MKIQIKLYLFYNDYKNKYIQLILIMLVGSCVRVGENLEYLRKPNYPTFFSKF